MLDQWLVDYTTQLLFIELPGHGSGFLQLGHLHRVQPCVCFQLHCAGIGLEVDVSNSRLSWVCPESDYGAHCPGAGAEERREGTAVSDLYSGAC